MLQFVEISGFGFRKRLFHSRCHRKSAVVVAVEDFTGKDDEDMGGRFPGVSRREFFRYPLAASAIALLERAGFGRTRSGNQTLPVQEQSDLLIRNARVYTVEKDRPWAQAGAI